MKLPTIVIVGRTNVGKSTLFNRILKKRISVVADRAGVTRDLHFQDSIWNNKKFQLVDTGGFLMHPQNRIDELVIEKIDTALYESDVIIFLTDGKVGITEEDVNFLKRIRPLNKVIYLAVNKTESRSVSMDIHEFWSLGLGEPYAISALNGDGVPELMDEISSGLPKVFYKTKKDNPIRIAVLGKPNSGKSTVVNKLIGENRQIVSSEAGTTRDSIDTAIVYKNQQIILTDTAGLRKKARVKDEVEYYCNLRAIEAIRRSDVCILLVDATVNLEIQDSRIMSMISEAGKAGVLCLNKWDLVNPESKTFDQVVKQTRIKMPELAWVPILSISGLTGKRLDKMIDAAIESYHNLNRVLGRDQVIEFFQNVVARHPHPNSTKGNVKFEKCCQVGVNPPALAMQVKNLENILPSYVRYLKKAAYDFFQLEGTPLRLYFRHSLMLRKDEDLQQFLDKRSQGKERDDVKV